MTDRPSRQVQRAAARALRKVLDSHEKREARQQKRKQRRAKKELPA